MEAMGSPLSHQQLLTSIPSSLPTSSNGFFIEIHENIIKVAFFIEDDIWALEHEDVLLIVELAMFLGSYKES